MFYFRLKRPAQFALIGAALIAPGCYTSSGDDDEADVHWEAVDPPPPDTWDARDDFVLHDDPAPDWRDARDDAVLHDDMVAPDEWDATDDAEPDWVVDCVPSPNCNELDTGSLAVASYEAGTDYGVAEVRLEAPDLAPDADMSCSTWPCLEVAPAGGIGTVSDVTPVDRLVYRFRYTNPTMAWGDMVQLDLTWHVGCYNAAGSWEERTITGTAWACRDDTFRILVTGGPGACPTVVDDVPKPMGPDAGTPSGSGEAFNLRAVPGPDGRFRLAARGPAGTHSYRWIASGGTLRMLSPADAVFEPAPDAGLFMVQVAAFTRSGVSIQVYRKRRA